MNQNLAGVFMYSIKHMATITGIGVHTLRAWERRYEIIKPSRNSKGRRSYSEEDLDFLKIVSELVHLGEPIGTIAKLDRDQIYSKWANLEVLKSMKESKYERFSYSLVVIKTSLEINNRAVIVHELTTLQSELDQKNFSISNLLNDFIIPMHAELSKYDYMDEEKGPIVRLTYLLLTQLLRQALSYQTQNLSINNNEHPVLIGSVGSIRGEVDGLICTIRTLLQGTAVIFIGNKLSQQTIQELVKRLGAEKVIITDRRSPFKAKLNLCEVFDQFTPENMTGVQWAVLLNEAQSSSWPCCVPHVDNLKTYTSFESLDQFLNVS